MFLYNSWILYRTDNYVIRRHHTIAYCAPSYKRYICIFTSTIKVYFSAIVSFYFKTGRHGKLYRQLTLRLQQVIKARACNHQTSERSPPQLLRYYPSQTVSDSVESQKYYNMIMQEAWCLVFFSFLMMKQAYCMLSRST